MPKKNFILDTSALIAYLADEKGASEVSKILPDSKIPFICLSELYYLVWQKRGRAEADKIYGTVKSWDFPILYPNERIILNAGRIKATYKLGISDSYIASFAIEGQAPLITKDSDYNILAAEVEIMLIGK